MFLPQDLTRAERDLVEAVTLDLIARRCPSSPSEEEAVRHEASQVAAEMILETRGQSQAPTDEDEGLEAELASSPYHQRLARLRAENLALQEADDEEAARPQ